MNRSLDSDPNKPDSVPGESPPLNGAGGTISQSDLGAHPPATQSVGTTRSPNASPTPAATELGHVSKDQPRVPKRTEAKRRVVPTTFTELEDGTLVEVIESLRNPARTLLAVWKEGRFQYRQELGWRNSVLVAVRKSSATRSVRLPHGIGAVSSHVNLLGRVESLLRRCVSLSQENLMLLAHFVLATWFIDRLPVAPYVALVGLPQSGKTTLLRTLSLVCRRSLLTADISVRSLYGISSVWKPTLLIDENGTASRPKQLRHALRFGTTPGIPAIRGREAFDVFGAKVLSWSEPPDDPALVSRCLLIPMVESNSAQLVRPSDPTIIEEANDLQRSLLRFRLENLNRIQVCEVPGGEDLRPRTRELLNSLAAPFQFFPEDFRKEQLEVLHALLQLHEKSNAEPLSLEQNAVLRALFYLVHQMRGLGFLIGDITVEVNKLLKQGGEGRRLAARRVGSLLTVLGITERRRTNRGFQVGLNQADVAHIHYLVSIYGVDNLSGSALKVSPSNCPLCPKEGEAEEGHAACT